MKEIIVKETLGSITSNLKDVAVEVRALTKTYECVEYTGSKEDRLAQMKEDRATLNKLAAAISDERKRVKKSYLAPLEDFEALAKKLEAEIKIPAGLIDTSAKQIEAEMREERKAKIREFYNKMVDANASYFEAEGSADKFFEQLYDPKWANATTTQKTWKEGILESMKEFIASFEAIKATESDYIAEGIQVLRDTMNLNTAMAKMNELKRIQDEAIERARKRMEEEKRRAAAREEMERRRAEEAEARLKQAQTELERAKTEADISREIINANRNAAVKMTKTPTMAVTNGGRYALVFATERMMHIAYEILKEEGISCTEDCVA